MTSHSDRAATTQPAPINFCREHNEAFSDDGESMCEGCYQDHLVEVARATAPAFVCVACGCSRVDVLDGEDTCAACLREIGGPP